MKKVYLDYAATTPMSSSALLAYQKTAQELIGNASSAHSFGRAAAVMMDRVREEVASLISAKYNEIIFTSGASEANNLAIFGLLRKFKEKRPDFVPHIITTKIEHASVLESFKQAEALGLASVTFLDVNQDGLLDIDQLKKSITRDTILLSIIYVNNETGAIQPLRKIGKIVRQENEHREKEIWERRAKGDKSKEFGPMDKMYFHVDAVQAVIYSDCSVELGIVDLMTLSGHKIFGPKGVGVLYVRSGTPISQILAGGDQELSLRPGTLNVTGIVAFGEAVKEVVSNKNEWLKKVSDLNNYLRNQLNKIPGIVLNSSESASPHIINFSVENKIGERVMLQLDQKGVAVSTGSACSSGAVEPSHVLKAMQLEEDRINGALRISLSHLVTIKDLEDSVKILSEVLK